LVRHFVDVMTEEKAKDDTNYDLRITIYDLRVIRIGNFIVPMNN